MNRTDKVSAGAFVQTKGMNRKGITDTVLILILSSITIVMVFVGVIFAYQQLACYAGINWEQKTFPTPTEASFLASRINIESVNIDITNQSKCKIDRPSDPTFCELTYSNNETNYADFSINISYWGATYSAVGLNVNEQEEEKYTNDKGTEIKASVTYMIYNGQTPDKLFTRESYVFNFIQPIRDCTGSNLSLKAFAASNNVYGVAPGYWDKTVDFCTSPPIRDVNVSVKGFTKDAANNDDNADIEINGSEVQYLCPNATIYFSAYDKNGNNTQLYECNQFVNSRADKWDGNYTLRTSFTMENDIRELFDGTKEAAVVTLNFSESQLKLGFPHNMSNCSEVSITQHSIRQNLLQWVDHSSAVYSDPVGYDINRDGVSDSKDVRCLQVDVYFVPNLAIESGKKASFDAYFQWTGTIPRPSQIYDKDLKYMSSYFPTLTWTNVCNSTKRYEDPVMGTFYSPNASWSQNLVCQSGKIMLDYGKCPP